MKYIDAEKLIAEIERLQKRAEDLEELSLTVGERSYWSGESGVLALLTQFINSLQQEQPEGMHFTPLMRLINKIPSENWNGAVNNYAKKLRDCLIKEGYRKDAEVLQGYISYMNGNNVPMAIMDEREQPEQTCKTCGFYENNCPFIRGKLIPYPNKVCKDYTYSAMKEQEQPEVVKVFSRPFLPSNLDEAANDYCSAYYDWDNEGERKEVVRTFKSGAEWMAGQFQKIDGSLDDWYETNGVEYCHGISTDESFEVPEGFYIRKK